KEHNQTPLRRERPDRRGKLRVSLRIEEHQILRQLDGLPSPQLSQRRSMRDLPDPSRKRLLLAKLAACAQCSREGLLDDLSCELGAADHGRERIPKPHVPLAI